MSLEKLNKIGTIELDNNAGRGLLYLDHETGTIWCRAPSGDRWDTEVPATGDSAREKSELTWGGNCWDFIPYGGEPDNLRDLLDLVQTGFYSSDELSDLPTFGGHSPVGSLFGILSWDSESILIGGDCEPAIIDRSSERL